MFSSVGEVDRESDKQPDDQAPPVLARQRQHQKQANQNAGDRNKWKQRCFERTGKLRIRSAHDQHSGAHDDERQQSPDIYQFRQNPQRKERCHNANETTGENCRFPRRTELFVNSAKERLRNQAITRHCQHHARLAEHQHKENRSDSCESAQ